MPALADLITQRATEAHAAVALAAA